MISFFIIFKTFRHPYKMKTEMSIFRLAVLSLCLFVVSGIRVYATEPVTVSDRTSPCLSTNEIVDINLITIKFQEHDSSDVAYWNWIDNKNSMLINFHHNSYFRSPDFRRAFHTDWVRMNSGLLGNQSDDMNLRKTDSQGLLSSITQAYAYQLNLRLLIQSYRELLLNSFSSVITAFLEGPQSDFNETTSNYFGHFYDSLADNLNINKNSGKFWIDPSFGFGSTGIKCSYKFFYGTISSSWNMDENKFLLKVRIPFNNRNIHYPIIENLGFPTQNGH